MGSLFPTILEKSWKIPKNLTKEFSRARLVEILMSINKINDTTSYYIRDSYEKKIIVDSPTSTILCGYAKEIAEEEGFAFYKRISAETDWSKFEKMFLETYKIFYKHPPAKRKHLVSSYDLAVQTASKGKLILRHKSIPFKLCDNGNLWLSLGSVSVSTEKRPGNATVTNTETGEVYVYVNDEYVLSDLPAITQEELQILELMCNDLPNEQIMLQLNFSERSFWRKRQRLFNKLNVQSGTGAIHKAHLMGII